MNPSCNNSIPVQSIKVSVIVSTYKSSEFIRGCLEDLVTQTLYQKGEVEIIIIDSASPENEGEIIQEFQENYPNIIYQRTQERETLYCAWNRAIKLARGLYLTNGNTDDRHCFNALEIMANYLDNNREISLVYADQLITTIKNDTFATTPALKHWNWPNYSYQQMRQGCCVGSQPMWRKMMHDKYGYFQENFRCAGDYEFWLRIGSQGEKMALIPEILGLYYLNIQGLEHGSNGQALEEHYQVCKIHEIPHPEIKDIEIKPNPVNMEDLGIILQEEEREKLQIIQAISQKKPPIIVIDGVIFQLEQRKLARVWSSILEYWSQLELSQHIVILDRNNSAPRWEEFKYWTAESYDYNCTGKDARKVQAICDRLQANLFISTFYTSPLTTPSLLFLASEFPEENGNLPVNLEKHYAILSASIIIAFSSNIAQDLRRLYPKITSEKINVIELFEVNQKIAEEITDFLWYALSETKESSQHQVWLELRKLQEKQQIMSLKQQQDYRTMQRMEISLKELENNHNNLQKNNHKLQEEINYLYSRKGIVKTIGKTPILLLAKLKKKLTIF
ncbi:MAG: glycosyltransferase [Microcystis panniformis Mp_MB_F_20051200_S9]|uniref:Glycosyltransferase n=1 Tax=Microcystis panniformis Mp_MB_F_20051200_S9 TaxID=2486223 RepID=A0A552Q3Y1_9CHRO|nr:MAG: glycosyltransferase [Microcystis panniformis Mp_MB_F_20080800_S26D]TRV52124.1 MAG: glycosyltransferase [Microcystis panniformis Mp_GB_SS_20050300_S99D]TRV53278.1 MAG: glycosyltransferase [Microcystis panniformis Mp_GB_SS_20050300_S99]TRV61419.1 MAG: glycosyltransferase [Microcystis panniformis Mp_MB_F_20051200_S9D]TRV62452.1 MAG: glycosyltransferase [Microcystis panniformis Mp_MB_F_20080800_S26]TRV63916.1 MAG: glycosyltransferase [Microcystis panniformis Mp_MB_F_20051200_S9]TRV70169.1